MSDADSTVAVGTTATACASTPNRHVAGADGNDASAAETAANNVAPLARPTPAGSALTTPTVVSAAPTVDNSVASATRPTADSATPARVASNGAPTAPAAANSASPPTTAATTAALMSRRFRGFLPVVIDVETGGFHSATDALLEIAAVIIDMEPDGTLKRGATHSFHVKPFEGARLDPAALAITGIDPFHPLRPALPEKDALGRVFREIRHAIHAYNCRRAILVGHNAAFDLGFLNAAVVRADVKRNPFHPFSCFDTATLAGAALGQTVLAKALAVAGIQWDPSSAHSASYDAERTADVFCLICNRLSDSFRDAQDRARAMGWVNAAPAVEAAADEPPSLET
jgi:ribonuclease T